ncbi:integrase [Alphaproteobacteria bacterium 46_93_T64]|nr:integrase [Alphaproteobacteria bacterium 46_93_T64]
MAAYRRRGNNWQVQIRREDHPPLSKSFKLKSDGERWARTIESAIDRGELIQASGTISTLTTLADLMVRYRDNVTPKKRGAEVETLRINKFLQHPLCSTKLKHITPPLIAQYRDDRLKTVSGETVRRDLTIISHAFNVAIREWGVSILINPVTRIEKPKPAKGRDRRITEDELQALLEGCTKSRITYLAPVIRLAVHTGMRRGELLAMRWEHLDLEDNVLLIPQTKNGHPREIPLSEDAVRVLRELDPQEGGEVFGVAANALRLSWERLRNRVGLSDLRFHDLRHEAISRFFELGLSLPEVALISGHREPRMLMRYTHLKARTVAQKLNAICSV